MRKIKQVLRLHFEAQVSGREIARLLSISRDSAHDYVIRAKSAGLSWPLPEPYDNDEALLEARLFPSVAANAKRRVMPNWVDIRNEMQIKGATLTVLHEEYLAVNPDGMRYSRFCELYRKFERTLKRSMRQIYLAGEKVQVDYAGPTVPIYDMAHGLERHAQIFVGILPASSYTYAEAQWSQSLPDWLSAHARMFAFFGGVPKLLICDNLKSGVVRAHRTNPVLNRSYEDLAEHYGCTVMPTRKRKPGDKAPVENGVLIIERWILFRLRKRVFTSVAELNEAIAALLKDLNERPFKKLAGNRRSAFETIDRPALQDLPERPYEYAEFRRVLVGSDYRVDVDGCRYSVPHALCRQHVDVRITAHAVEVLHRGKRVTSHVRIQGDILATHPEHLPPTHHHYSQWQAVNDLVWAEAIGPAAVAMAERVCAQAKHRDLGYRAHESLKELLKEYGPERLEAACERALAISAYKLSSVRSILSSQLDRAPLQTHPVAEAAFNHENVRGPAYYK